MSWPIEMSRLIADYAGYMKTTAHIEWEDEIERKSRQIMMLSLHYLQKEGSFWYDWKRRESEMNDDPLLDNCVAPSFIRLRRQFEDINP